MENKARKMLKKQIAWNLAAIVLIVVVLNLGISVYPNEGMKTRDTTLRFEWLGLNSYAIVDDNPDFTSPVMVEKDRIIELEPDRYYWCVPFFKQCLKKSSFEIQSEVSIVGKKLSSDEENATYLVENTGNTPTRIEINNFLGRLITGFFILEPQAANVVKINETANIIATQE